MKLMLNALTKFILGVVLVGAMLFLPAWTLHYPNAWLFMALLFVPMLLMGTVLFIKAPALLKKRLDNKEKEKAQKGVIALSGLMFPMGYTSLPYSKISAFSLETAGVFDMDAELTLHMSGVGRVKFEFTGNTDVKEICLQISKYALN